MRGQKEPWPVHARFDDKPNQSDKARCRAGLPTVELAAPKAETTPHQSLMGCGSAMAVR
jgi:hypothetical protein